jgi:hypothetical protein
VDALTFASNVISDVAWPAAAVSLALIFRVPIANRIANLSSVDAFGVKATFAQLGRTVTKVNKAVAPSLPDVSSLRLASAGPITVPRVAFSWKVAIPHRRVASGEPRDTVIKGWALAEDAARAAANRQGIPISDDSCGEFVVQTLALSEKLPWDAIELSRLLARLNFLAQTEPDFRPSESEMSQFTQGLAQLIAMLKDSGRQS